MLVRGLGFAVSRSFTSLMNQSVPTRFFRHRFPPSRFRSISMHRCNTNTVVSKACQYDMYKYIQGKHGLLQNHAAAASVRDSCRRNSATGSGLSTRSIQSVRITADGGVPCRNIVRLQGRHGTVSSIPATRSIHVVVSQQVIWAVNQSMTSRQCHPPPQQQRQQWPSLCGNSNMTHLHQSCRHYNDNRNGNNNGSKSWGNNNGTKNWGNSDNSRDDEVSSRNSGKDVMGLGITVTRKKGKETGYCYGCGADLVKEGAAGETKAAPKKKGFWADQKDFLKKAQIKNWALCPRCKHLKKLEESDGHINEDMSKLLGPNHQMTEVFRDEVGTIRKKEKVVVVMCVDAINVSGTLIRTIRNYVGGNPILIAITRCDLLPDYVYEDKNIQQLKSYFLKRCAEIQPAAVYLCSEDKEKMQEVGGIKELAGDLWEHLNGRDPYVIGAANIGKSTLTDILIAGFINRGQRMGYFRDRLALKRVDKLREARVTKSALPGTTLQNIRVPCFVDHQHALWDTPGLLLDESTAHFPIRNFREIRAKRPTQVVPHVYAVPKKSLCLLITEKDDEFPLIRVEIRLKKSDKQGENDEDSPVNVIWNSTLDLDSHIFEIKDAHLAEQDRFKRFILDAAPTSEEIAQKQKQLEQDHDDNEDRQQRPRTEEERKSRKEEKRLAYLQRIKVEQEEMGKEEWYRREGERKRKFFDEQRSKVLAKLVEVNQVVVDSEVGMDVAIANFGWIGFACGSTAMIKVYAPNSGVRVVCTPTMALPGNVGHYRTPPAPEKVVEKQKDKKKQKKKMGGNDHDMDDDDDDDFEFDDIEDDDDGYGYGNYGEFAEDGVDYGGGQEYSGFDGMDEFGFGSDSSNDEMEDVDIGKKRRWYNPEEYKMDKENSNDPWAMFSGKNVGWQFDDDMRFSKSKTRVEGWNPIFEDDPNKKNADEEDDIF